MISELDLLLDVACRLEEAGLDYMLTGSMALNHYAQPRMTRDIDMVIALLTGADMDYVKTWSQKLNLTAMLTRVSR